MIGDSNSGQQLHLATWYRRKADWSPVVSEPAWSASTANTVGTTESRPQECTSFEITVPSSSCRLLQWVFRRLEDRMNLSVAMYVSLSVSLSVS